MTFEDLFFNKEYRFSLGIEKESGQYYLSIPVSSGIVDYEEYYKIKEEEFLLFKDNVKEAFAFASLCRTREKDELLFHKPGSNRGVPV